MDRLACLAGRSWRASNLPGGLTNVNLRVQSDDDLDPLDVVVRWARGDAELLGIDRDAEHANSAAAYEAGVGAEVLEYRPELSLMVIAFLPGTSLTNADFADPGVLRRSADAVRALNAGPRFIGDFDMFARQAGYLESVREHRMTLPAGYTDHAAAWDDVRRALAAAPRPTVPCNNDLLAANYLDDATFEGHGRVWLIDYEYSGNNDACFELGNTTTECDFTEDMIDAWCEAYFGDPTPADRARVRVQALCSQYGWALWGFIQEATSPIDFDFGSWGMERYEKADATFRGGRLPTLLEQVAEG
ncbi:MAG TPA: LPS biosynthesis choline kinase [Nocardioides sp.]|uniref:LPS biosynthesis choline kinase n=1 Tax=Nocardioides sp. TaxID=35761 RepID=UPI002E339319|nr:LPS biosynthesis choline kinase [Nocardioides sp.]HEX3931595.1 LPS biosynthesis choline kinase [Nocardioides sp.]